MFSSLLGDLAPRKLSGVDGMSAAAAGAVSTVPTVQRASAMVTLLDPSRLWASQVVHALADAAGQPVQRLNLRERATLRTLAVIERTLVPRRQAGALRVYHAAIRASAMAQGLAQDEISNALAERSELTVSSCWKPSGCWLEAARGGAALKVGR